MRWAVALLLVATAGTLAIRHLASAPAPWWDEGWTMQVARNWVERGHYGRLSNGQPAGANLAFGLPVTGPVALSFRLLGAGFWQARLVTVLYMMTASVLFYALVARLWNSRLAPWTLAVSLFLSPLPSASAILLGRQVLGEWPMLAYLLAGALALLAGLQRRWWSAVIAAFFFAAAVAAKSQLQPFLLLGLAATLLFSLLRGDRGTALRLAAVAVGSAAFTVALHLAQERLLPGWRRDPFDIGALYRVTVVVLEPLARWQALRLVLLAALPSLAGIVHGARRLRRERPSPRTYVTFFLLALCAAWFSWFLLLSAGWPRYLFPPVYLATPFVVSMLAEWMALPSPWRRGAAVALGLQVLCTGAWALSRLLQMPGDTDATEVAAFLNREVPANARIESFESEVLFLLDRPYHYPPLDTHVLLIRNFQHGQSDLALSYDDLEADPDFLVLGRFSGSGALYRASIAAGEFRLVRTFGVYEIYERVRRP